MIDRSVALLIETLFTIGDFKSIDVTNVGDGGDSVNASSTFSTDFPVLRSFSGGDKGDQSSDDESRAEE
jgi:hypothetical protein